MDAGWIGRLLVPFTGGIALGTTLGGRYADRIGRRRTILLGALGCALFAAAYALLTTLPPDRVLLLPMVLLTNGLGASLGFNWPGQLTLMVEWFPKIWPILWWPNRASPNAILI